jgi:hypothetical protein
MLMEVLLVVARLTNGNDLIGVDLDELLVRSGEVNQIKD